MRPALALTLFLFAGLALAAPPDVPRELKVKPGQLVRVTVKGDAPLGTLKNFTDEEAFWGELVSPKGQRQFVFQAPADGKRATYVVGWWAKGETEGVSTTIVVEGGKVTPDPEPGPGPAPDPKPGPVTSFRAVIVYESSHTHSAAQKAVMEGKVVEDWLTANCTGGKAGWGRRDWSTDPATDTTPLRDLWAAEKGNVKVVPCVVVEVNGEAKIEQLAATPADMVKVLAKYREGR